MEEAPSSIESICRVFNIFHDGSLEHVQFDAGRLNARVDIPYLADRVKPGFTFFSMEISGFRDAQFNAWPEESGAKDIAIADLRAIFSPDLEILSASVENGGVKVICNISSPKCAYCGGELFFRADSIRVLDEANKAYSVDELGSLCKEYWDNWKRKNGSV